MKLLPALLTLAGFIGPVAAYAVPITPGSQINLAGFARSQPDNGQTALNDAVGLDFTNGVSPSPTGVGPLMSANGSGDFAMLGTCSASCGTIVDILDFSTFTTRSAEFVALLPGGTVTFDLTAPLTITRVAPNASTGQLATLIVAGRGFVDLAGYDRSPAAFTLTSQGATRTTFSASATILPVTVPDPRSIAVLAVGLIGLGMTRNRSRARA